MASEPYVLQVPLPAAPLAGREWAQWQEDPDVCNVALTAPGDDRKVKATAADLTVLSKWFAGKMRQRGGMGGGSLLSGVEVPVEVPFPVLRDFINGLYAGSITLTEDNLSDTLVLADAMQVEEAFAACIKSVAQSLSPASGTLSWARRVFEAGSGKSTGWEEELQSRALGHVCYMALSDDSYLLPLAAMLATVDSTEERLEAISRGLKGVFPGRVAFWPTGPLVCLVMRLDQRVDAKGGGGPPGWAQKRRRFYGRREESPLTEWDVGALMSEVDFSDLQTAERRALLQQATACVKRSPALFVALQRLVQQELIREFERKAPTGRAGSCTTGTLDLYLEHEDEGPDRVYTLRDVDPKRNRLFRSENDDSMGNVATLEVQHDDQGHPFMLGEAITLMFLRGHGSSLAGQGIKACVYYSIAATVQEGVRTEEALDGLDDELDTVLGKELVWGTGMVGVFLVFNAE